MYVIRRAGRVRGRFSLSFGSQQSALLVRRAQTHCFGATNHYRYSMCAKRLADVMVGLPLVQLRRAFEFYLGSTTVLRKLTMYFNVCMVLLVLYHCPPSTRPLHYHPSISSPSANNVCACDAANSYVNVRSSARFCAAAASSTRSWSVYRTERLRRPSVTLG